MNTGRTHASAAAAFQQHCDYACPLTIHRDRSWAWANRCIALIGIGAVLALMCGWIA